jgi:phosphatidate phosphatase APP1
MEKKETAMAGWQQLLGGVVSSVEDQFDRLKARLDSVLGGDDPIVIVPYLGYGTPELLFLRGRVLEDSRARQSMDNDTLWNNVLNSYRRFESDEIPFARVRVHFQGEPTDLVADDEGFFVARLQPLATPPVNQLWHQVELELLEPLREGHSPVHATAQILVPPVTAQFGVISDIDDTIVHSYATELLRMARIVFLGNARTRLAFPGVAAFYQALQGGRQGSAQNPLFFLSSSPWNLYDLLVEFFRLQDIPTGPLFLRDWGISAAELLPTGHSTHKLGMLRHILNVYPHLLFILIGDSGQEDPEIYRTVVDEFPDRILAVYIRDVSPEKRDAEVQRLAIDVSAARSSLVLAEDTLTMARHAAVRGWIDPDLLPLIAGAVARDKEAPTAAEVLLDEVP